MDKSYHWINDSVKIDFALPSMIQELVDELDADAQLYRAVNTVVLRDGKIRGCNTDGRGFLQMLLEAGISPEGKTITVLGAGGAARAVVLKLAQSHPLQSRSTGTGISHADYALRLG